MSLDLVSIENLSLLTLKPGYSLEVASPEEVHAAAAQPEVRQYPAVHPGAAAPAPPEWGCGGGREPCHGEPHARAASAASLPEMWHTSGAETNQGTGANWGIFADHSFCPLRMYSTVYAMIFKPADRS